MTSQRRQEGYLLVDHRAASGHIFEAATYTCSHCQRVVVINPDRTRERAYCRGCDHRICDDCNIARAAAGLECLSFERLADRTQEAAEHGRRLPLFNPYQAATPLLRTP